MDSPSSPPAVVRLDLFFPSRGAGGSAAALPSLSDVQAGNRCLVVGPRGSAKSALLLNYCCRAALAEADPRRRRALLIASRAHLEREPLPPALSSAAAATTAAPAATSTIADPSKLVDVKYVEDVQGLKAVGAALHTYRRPDEGYACVAVLGLSQLLRQAGGGGGGGGGADVGAAPDAFGGGGGRASRDREVTRALALLCDAADSQGCALIVADDALLSAGGGGGGASPPPGGIYGGGGGHESPAPVAAAPSPAGAPVAGYWAQRWFPVTLALSEEAGGEFVMRAIGGAGGGGGGGGGGTPPGGARHGGGGGGGRAGAAATTTTTTLPPELARARVRYAVAASGEVAVVAVET